MKKWFKINVDDSSTYPPVGVPVLVVLRNCHTFVSHYVTLKHVCEDDVSWRTVDDDSEISYSWNVILWQNITPPNSEELEPSNQSTTDKSNH